MPIHYFLILLRFLICDVSICNFLKYRFEFCNTLKQRRASLEEYKETFLPVPSIEDRKPVFLSRSTRDALDRIVRMFGGRKMSVSGLVENIARQHLATYGEDIEAWRKL